jgi:hypothetical protein
MSLAWFQRSSSRPPTIEYIELERTLRRGSRRYPVIPHRYRIVWYADCARPRIECIALERKLRTGSRPCPGIQHRYRIVWYRDCARQPNGSQIRRNAATGHCVLLRHCIVLKWHRRGTLRPMLKKYISNSTLRPILKKYISDSTLRPILNKYISTSPLRPMLDKSISKSTCGRC